MKIRTQLKAGRKAGGTQQENHNETLRVRSAIKAGRAALLSNHNEALQVRTALRAGGIKFNHNEALRVRTTLRAGGVEAQHNEKLERASERATISMRREVLTTGRKEDRLELLVVRAGLRAGKRAFRARGRERN